MYSYNLYGSAKTMPIVSSDNFHPIGKEGIQFLAKKFTRVFPEEIWEKIWGYMINPTHVTRNCVTEKEYRDILGLSLVSKECYAILFPPIYFKLVEFKIKLLSIEFTYIRNMDAYYVKEWHFNKLLKCTQLALHFCKRKYPTEINDKARMVIKNNTKCAIHVLRSCEHKICQKENPINEDDFIFLSDIYEYDYESVCMWKFTGWTSIACYIPCLIACCPVLCICSPCIIGIEFMECLNHDPGEAPGPYLCIPFALANTKRKHLGRRTILNDYRLCQGRQCCA